MLTHALTTALESGLFDHVHVSTEDNEIAAVAAAAGAAPAFKRDNALSGDYTPIRDVVRADLTRFSSEGSVFDTVVLLYATAVLIEVDDLKRAFTAFAENFEKPLLAVVDAGAPLERLMVNSAGVLRPVSPEQFSNRSQDLTPAYRDAGTFSFFSSETLEADKDGPHTLEFTPFFLPLWKGVDIDTEDDWRFAELLKAGLATTPN
jgi:N-acylneuraminate cytidylyltransferase